MDLEGMSILIVDDNSINLKVLKESLSSLGVDIKTSESGESAIEMLEEFTPSLIILDVMMPGMDGFELCRYLKTIKKFEGTSIVFVSALNDDNSEAIGLELGAVDFITKPINPGLVKARIKNILELKYYQYKLESRVEKSEKQFFELFDNSPDAQLLISYDDLKIHLANKSSEILFGYSKEELCKMGTMELAPDKQPNGMSSYDYGQECYRKSLNGEISSFEWIHKKKDGKEFPCEIRLMPFGGEKASFRVSIFDISERKKNEEIIARANKYVESIMNSMPYSLIGVDNNIKISHWNNYVRNETGKDREAVIGMDLVNVFPRMKLELDIIKESITKGIIKKRIKRSRVTDQGTIYENITIFPLNKDGFNGAVIIIDNITKEVELQDRVVQSERMLSLGDLTAGVVHEITNPLAGIIQNSQSLINRLTGNLAGNVACAQKVDLNLDSLQQYLEERKIVKMISSIRDSGVKASHIIKNLNSFTRRDKGAISYNKVDGLVTQAVELAENDFSISGKLDFKTIVKDININSNLPMIRCEASKIIQVFVNILRFSTKNISLAGGVEGRISIIVSEKNGDVEIKFKDNGFPIPQEDLKNIFKPYFESKMNREDWYYIALSDFIIKDIHSGNFYLSSQNGNEYIITLPSKDH